MDAPLRAETERTGWPCQLCGDAETNQLVVRVRPADVDDLYGPQIRGFLDRSGPGGYGITEALTDRFGSPVAAWCRDHSSWCRGDPLEVEGLAPIEDELPDGYEAFFPNLVWSHETSSYHHFWQHLKKGTSVHGVLARGPVRCGSSATELHGGWDCANLAEKVVHWVYDRWYPEASLVAVCADHRSKAIQDNGDVESETVWDPERGQWYRSTPSGSRVWLRKYRAWTPPEGNRGPGPTDGALEPSDG